MDLFFSPNGSARHGVLLVNFGTPAEPSYPAVWSFLSKVLGGHLASVPKLVREGWIIPRRLIAATHKYRTIWTPEGSPLMVQSRLLAKALAKSLPTAVVALAMQFGAPSVALALEQLRPLRLEKLSILPLVPAPTLAFFVEQAVRTWPKVPIVHDCSSFSREAWYEDILASRLLDAHPEAFDRVIVSFHGLPVRSSPHYRDHALHSAVNVTARLPAEKVRVAFQSKVGHQPWTEPSTSAVLAALRAEGAQRVLVLCPSFVVDCLESLYDVAIGYRLEFLRLGGTELALVPALNHDPLWVRALSAFL